MNPSVDLDTSTAIARLALHGPKTLCHLALIPLIWNVVGLFIPLHTASRSSAHEWPLPTPFQARLVCYFSEPLTVLMAAMAAQGGRCKVSCVVSTTCCADVCIICSCCSCAMGSARSIETSFSIGLPAGTVDTHQRFATTIE